MKININYHCCQLWTCGLKQLLDKSEEATRCTDWTLCTKHTHNCVSFADNKEEYTNMENWKCYTHAGMHSWQVLSWHVVYKPRCLYHISRLISPANVPMTKESKGGGGGGGRGKPLACAVAHWKLGGLGACTPSSFRASEVTPGAFLGKQFTNTWC